MRKTMTMMVASLFLLSFAACGDDDTAGGNNNNTANCTDLDGDGYGVGADCLGADCNDSDSACYAVGDACCTTTDCTDLDGDGYGVGADCLGADCDDADISCYEGACCGDCVDVDGDGFGEGTDCQGPDCDDNDVSCWVGACCPAPCVDVDGDGYGEGAGCLGPDCNDEDVACNAGACCPAGNGGVGEACGDVSQCTDITSGTPECLTSVGGYFNFPGGYCTGNGCVPGDSCDSDTGVCVDLFGFMQYCLKPCTVPSECREAEGYTCTTLPGGQAGDPTYCIPAA